MNRRPPGTTIPNTVRLTLTNVIKIKVVSNAVEVPDAKPEPTEPRQIVFTGLLRYLPNIQAARELIERTAPILIRRECRLPVIIAGADPDDALTGQRLPDNVTLITNPPDVTDLIRNGIMVVPLRDGGGSRFKIFEAFATAILDVAPDKVNRQRLVSAGWELAQDRYSITALRKSLCNTLLGM